jgi:hypothetical protein
MLEDYWLPRREGGRGTEVTTLPGGQNLGQMDDVLYFQKKFLQTLNVPTSRLNSDALFSIGRATEITRDELKFSRFIIRLRGRFSHLFTEMLKKQLILKGITTVDDWDKLSSTIKFDFAKDNYFAELKDAEIRDGRINQARNMQDMAGKYYSHEWIRKNVLMQTSENMAEEDAMIQGENQSQDPRWVNPTIIQNEQLAQQQEQENAQAQQAQQPPAPEQQAQDQKVDQIRQAMVFVKQMKAKGAPSNRSMQDQSKYKSAVQLIAKNPEIAQQIGANPEAPPPEQQQQ